MNKPNQRRRGRPPGTEKDDSDTLAKMADVMVRNPNCKKTPAIRQVLTNPDPSLVRRLQVKWKRDGARYLADAEARRAAPVPAPRSAGNGVAGTIAAAAQIDQLASSVAAACDAMMGPAMLARAAMPHAAIFAAHEAARNVYDSPEMRAMREFQQSPQMRLMMELQNSPAFQLVREMQAARANFGR